MRFFVSNAPVITGYGWNKENTETLMSKTLAGTMVCANFTKIIFFYA
jgi:hypothetical protein